MTMKPKLIIDTDAGHDDALAMMMIVRSQLFEILGITTVAGNSILKNVTRNAAYILNLLGERGRKLPIFSGYEEPLKRPLITAVVHGESGLDGVDLSDTKFRLTHNAPDKIVEIVRRYPGEITILTLGPLSNIARAFLLDPELPGLINKIVIMGGAIDVPGNKNRVAEFNIFVDPEAADIVFSSSVHKILVPLDPCNHIILSLKDFNQLKGGLLYEPIIGMMKKFIEGIYLNEGTKGALVYDAIAAYFLINPSAFKLEPMDIVVETEGRHTRGMTVVEKRKNETKNYNVDVVTSVSADQFKRDFIRLLR